MSMHPLLLSCLSLPLLLSGTGVVQAQSIQRCTNAEGATVFTDKACELVQARPRLATTPAAGNRASTERPIDARLQCPQRLSQLVDHIQLAIGSKDSNRLSAVYWWGGQGNTTASRVLERLEDMVQRPLVDIAPVYPPARATASSVTPPDLAMAPAVRVTTAPTAPDSSDLTLPAPQQSRPRPTALRIEQTLANHATRASNIVYLRRQYGCFWISF